MPPADIADRDADYVTDTQEDAPKPIVFQCIACRQIVADSTTWVRGTPELSAFTLAFAPSEGVVVSETLSTSSDSYDRGSTYTLFSCSNCSQLLGRIYHTTPRHLDELRDSYTFYTASVKNYQIGSNEPAQDPLPANVDFEILKPAPDATARRLAIMETLIMAMNDELEQLRADMAKLSMRSGSKKL